MLHINFNHHTKVLFFPSTSHTMPGEAHDVDKGGKKKKSPRNTGGRAPMDRLCGYVICNKLCSTFDLPLTPHNKPTQKKVFTYNVK